MKNYELNNKYNTFLDMQPSYVFAPYIPLVTTPIINPKLYTTLLKAGLELQGYYRLLKTKVPMT